jgi:hypothetical protein
MAEREMKVLTRGRGAWWPRDEIRGRVALACLKARRRPSQSASPGPIALDPTRLVRSPTTCCHLPSCECIFVTLHALGDYFFLLGSYSSTHTHQTSLYSVARDARPTRAGALKSEPSPYLNIKLPDLSAPLPEPEVHIVGIQLYDCLAKSAQNSDVCAFLPFCLSPSPRTFGSLHVPRRSPPPPYLKNHRSPRSSSSRETRLVPTRHISLRPSGNMPPWNIITPNPHLSRSLRTCATSVAMLQTTSCYRKISTRLDTARADYTCTVISRKRRQRQG